jgi:outer membrane immunogenic protein
MGDKTLKTLKTALLGATFLIGASAAASAADVYQRGSYKDPAPVEYMPAITWAGFYFGVNAGMNFYDVEYFNGFEEDDSEFIAGLHVGYNFQWGSPWVFGVEADVGFADGIDYNASLRARLGYAMGNSMVYATGGAAWLGFEDDFSDDDALSGWVVGLGLEHKFTQNVSFGVEGLYYNYGDGDDFNIDGDIDNWTVRARLSYHLGPRYEEALK